MATPTQLSLYNGALLLLGVGILSDTSEDREPRRVLDNVWNRRAVDYCLRQGLWNFAVRTVKATHDSDLAPDFGFPYLYGKPSDWIKTAAVASDEFFESKLTGHQYRDETNYWRANLTPIYIRYVSNGADYGTSYSKWPPDFERFVEAYLAKMAGPKIKGATAERVKMAEAIYDKLEAQAKSADAADDGPSSPPNGSWVQARMRGRGGDRGSRSSFTG